jgi:hypothetical protein
MGCKGETSMIKTIIQDVAFCAPDELEALSVRLVKEKMRILSITPVEWRPTKYLGSDGGWVVAQFLVLSEKQETV